MKIFIFGFGAFLLLLKAAPIMEKNIDSVLKSNDKTKIIVQRKQLQRSKIEELLQNN